MTSPTPEEGTVLVRCRKGDFWGNARLNGKDYLALPLDHPAVAHLFPVREAPVTPPTALELVGEAMAGCPRHGPIMGVDIHYQSDRSLYVTNPIRAAALIVREIQRDLDREAGA